MIIQFSRGGGQFIAGKTAPNPDDAACIAGTIAVRIAPPLVPVRRAPAARAQASIFDV